ncbi:MAG TPA: hypothetical protein V6C76_12335 [Drouetiella sp.]
MSTQDEDGSSKDSGSYQFFSHDSYSSYFGDQTPIAANTDLSAFTTSFSASDYTTSLSVPLPGLADVLPPQGGAPAVQSTTSSVSNFADTDYLSSPSQFGELIPNAVPIATPVAAPESSDSETAATRPVYSLKDDTPEPTFEERVAAMKKAAADKAELEKRPAPPPAKIVFNPSAMISGEITNVVNNAASAQFESNASTTAKADENGWHPYQPQQPAPVQQSLSTSSNTFSSDFDFNRSLLKIFWRIDVDHNNRVSKRELALALDENWFSGNERVLAKILFEAYEDISPEAIFCDAGLSVNNILSYGPFSDFANAAPTWSREEDSAATPSKSGNQQKKTTSQSMRWTKNRR